MKTMLITLILAVSVGSFSMLLGFNKNSYSYNHSKFSIVNKILPKIDTVLRYNDEYSVHVTGNPLYLFKQVGDLLDKAANYKY